MTWVSGCMGLLLAVALCSRQLSLASPAADLGNTRSDHWSSKDPASPLVLSKSKTLAVFAGERPPVPLTVHNLLLQQPDADSLPLSDTYGHLQPGINSLLQPEINSIPQPELDSLRQRDSEDLQEVEIDSLLEWDSKSQPERDPDVLIEAHMKGVREPVVDGWPQADPDVLLRDDVRRLRRVMVACHGVLQYYTLHSTNMNFDAVIGTRIAEAQFVMVVKTLEEGDVRAGVRALLREAEDLHSVAQSVIMQADPVYYHELGALLVAGFWEAPLIPRSLNTTTLSPPHDPRPVLSGEEQLKEEESDECLAEELGGGRGGGRRCTVSRVCWHRMTAPGYSGYSLTHQLFYLIIGIQAGCVQHLEQLMSATGGNRSLEGQMSELCAAVLVEAVAIAQANFPEHRRDLFMEQGALCGLIGYSDFFRREWMSRVLSWQRDSGCFGDASVFPGHHPVPPATHTVPLAIHPRVRREERIMADRCLAHRSSVALGYLSLGLRFLTLM